ncbi:Hypothetical_protein [Hexamita inflata]|uniref:Hypothetical_protein n=1 Tax=Hexamita inflata TaxID=28002 RepID=A0AA86U4T2_9EUKA|nr:Hypothetical protein HINF_LOCUS22122 [Hexamita inflata]CAI9937932.1 Hypothetical protein HINF_LOCUS25577 [Hexamita inflata]
MFKNLVWNIIQFVANPGFASIVLYRVILQLNSVVRPDSTERLIRINLSYSILQLLPWLSSQFTAVCFIFYHYTNFNQYFLIQDLDQIFSSSPVSISRSSTKTKTQITSDFFFSRIRSILVYLTIILYIVEASHKGG